MRPRAAASGALVLVTAVVLAACSDDDESGSTSAASSPATSAPGATAAIATTAPTSPPTIAATTTATTMAAPASGAPTTAPELPPATVPTTAPATTSPAPVFGNPLVASEEVVELNEPIGLAVRPGDDALYLIEQDGFVVRVDGGGGTTEVADVSDRTEGGGERGLLGIAFSLDGALAYLDYTDNDGDTVVAEYPVAADGTFDVGAERVLLAIDQPYSNHNGGDLLTGPDGTLYIAMGDGGAGGDPERRASDPTNLLGKLLRIDPRPSGDAPYTIPPDNPFASGAMNGIAGAPEVWSFGLRNPWKIALDPPTGELWIADVGQNAIEEINVVGPTAEHPAGWGANFGWSAFEGNDRYNDDVTDPGDLIFPVWTYGHDQGCSVSGGAVYRGAAIADLSPAYVYADYCAGTVWAFDAASGRNELLLDGFSRIAAVRTGPEGELYVVEQDGDVNRFVQG